ncbi:3-deoxy-manno-octulosonate-8-phosphatase KdsC [Pseudoalteromonas luteoviolacea]|uniref:3-deoxy-D-manno-octulosonate 8-phosphate phosphatase KdsC n=1 Tax=Pseudoalteromonas luteoviolacea S4054 TaxID=1129367 RepID=A0A0F6AD00_9GAMM|nr:3-deoxy-manno-octulosonate-8-phosphatase KdsC [Pseudoalteromonas luteoviolacea]AOT09790.1 3-deoxy-D-manno-octulosonate 8-phosphate phosphatase [Pseudoalteromonas luteoviolacea]AOT14702.1 3-deoxy-D-manno-octulosonate 8-phosphate phosphatase [Pseudoalteromonas luteoviolacea]AOT19617.1 3-deoxy-D-manno-octulosonate 8-phosphate phosphatase [Pseudoalteromonas luteoviolacea]KKE84060.1 3-deoxy-D-manno-octulosonate 8-phosphate phosphatase [Pseudoalteromonas luteoviolacea S4054]KZN77454.1 3-deoxy-D-m
MQFSELYQQISVQVNDKAKAIKLLICDIDGVFSDGRIYLGNQGEELKAFNTKDGFGIKALIETGVEVAVITGRHSEIVKQRMTSLNVNHIYQGQEDKVQAYEELKNNLNLTDEQIAYIGDDGPDIPVMQQVGFAVAVADAHPLVKNLAHYTTLMPGGFGAVRELTDLLMLSQGNELLSKGSST